MTSDLLILFLFFFMIVLSERGTFVDVSIAVKN